MSINSISLINMIYNCRKIDMYTGHITTLQKQCVFQLKKKNS